MKEEMKILINKDSISRRIEELARLISEDYRNKELIMIGILKGAFVFLADLIRLLKVPVKIDFVRLSSYGKGTESSGEVRITKDIEMSIEGRDVIVVEDIVDSGITLSYLIDELKKRRPNSLKCCVLIDKKERRKIDITIDYTGFSIEKGFIVGYGLDVNERYRYLPDIYVINQ
jgi:hypoxanthine phosphoribosyltransferase